MGIVGEKAALAGSTYPSAGTGTPHTQQHTGFRRLNIQVLAIVVLSISLMVGVMVVVADQQMAPIIGSYYGIAGLALVDGIDTEAAGQAILNPQTRDRYVRELVQSYDNMLSASFYIRQGDQVVKIAGTDAGSLPVSTRAITSSLDAYNSSMTETTLDSKPVMIITKPLHFGAVEPQAAGVFVLDLAERQAVLVRQRLRLLGTGVVGSLVIIGFLFAALRLRVIRPVEQLTQAVRQVTAGDLSVELSRGPANELGILATSFNAMVVELREYLNRVEVQAQELLTKNQEQTRLNSSLEAANLDMTAMMGKLEQAATELKEKNQELEAFVYTVSHDLKTPLVSLQGLSGILLDDYGERLDDEGRHCLKRLVDNTNQMGQLIQDLLAFSRVGRMRKQVESVEIADVVQVVLGNLQSVITRKQTAVELGPLPRIMADRTLVQQLFSNLISNAVKFSGHNGAAPRVEVGAREQDGMIEFYVKDNGIGIEPQYHAKVFEIFQRLHEVQEEGTGVGLSIVRKIVEQAGGKVRLESAKGQGAAFYFTWPQQASTQADRHHEDGEGDDS